METNGKIAILIDAENVSSKNGKQIIDVMKEKGDIFIKTVVADWTSDSNGSAKSWKKIVVDYAMTAIQQFTLVKDKNSVDGALIIEAMKILYEKPAIDTFCIVSSDSDFTRLAQEIKTHNKTVIGMGERKSIKAFTSAFDEFIYLGESLSDTNDPPNEEQKKDSKMINGIEITEEQIEYLNKIVNDAIEEKGEFPCELLPALMKKYSSDFTRQNFKCSSLTIFLKNVLPFLDNFEKDIKGKSSMILIKSR